MNDLDPLNYQPSGSEESCSECGGTGDMDAFSQVPARLRRRCQACKGSGTVLVSGLDELRAATEPFLKQEKVYYPNEAREMTVKVGTDGLLSVQGFGPKLEPGETLILREVTND